MKIVIIILMLLVSYVAQAFQTDETLSAADLRWEEQWIQYDQHIANSNMQKAEAVLLELEKEAVDSLLDLSLLPIKNEFCALYYDYAQDLDKLQQKIQETKQLILIIKKTYPDWAEDPNTMSDIAEHYLYQINYWQDVISPKACLDSALVYYDFIEQHMFAEVKGEFYKTIAGLYAAVGDFEKAEACYKQLLLLPQENPRNELEKLMDAANFYLDQGNNELAFVFFNKGLALNKKINDLPLAIDLNNFAAAHYWKQEQLDSVQYFIEKNLKLHQQSQYAMANTYELAFEYALHIEEDYELAAEYTFKRLDLAQAKGITSGAAIAYLYLDLAFVYYYQEDCENALIYGQEGLAALVFGYPKEDLQAQPVLDYVLDYTILGDILLGKSICAEVTGDIALSYATAKTGIELFEQWVDQRDQKEAKIELFQDNHTLELYTRGLALCYEHYQTTHSPELLDDMLRWMAGSKSLFLQSVLQGRKAKNFVNLPDSLVQKEYSLSKQLERLEQKKFNAQQTRNSKTTVDDIQTQIFQILKAKDQLKQFIAQHYPKYYQLKFERSLPKTADIQQKLDSETLLIEYSETEETIFVLVVSQQSAKIHQLPNSDSINASVKDFYKTLTNVSLLQTNPNLAFANYTKLGHQLYQTYLAPILPKDKTFKNLVIIPDGQLHYLPFELLLQSPTSTNTPPNYQNLSYLLQDYAISYHYSSTLWLGMHDTQNQNNGKILGFAPSYNYDSSLYTHTNGHEHLLWQSLSPLTGTVKELDMLKSKFSGDFYYAQEANETQFRAAIADSKYNVLHLAMHGLVDKRYTNFSGLFFTKTMSKQQDDILYAHELGLLDISANLVVLSACETGYGKYASGEGVLSVGRSFLHAGVPSLIMTLWPLNDAASSIVMEHFYSNLAAGIDKAKAMQQAQLSYLKNSKGVASHPFFWGSFSTIGNTAPIQLHSQNTQGGYGWLIAGIALLVGTLIVFVYKSRSKTTS